MKVYLIYDADFGEQGRHLFAIYSSKQKARDAGFFDWQIEEYEVDSAL